LVVHAISSRQPALYNKKRIRNRPTIISKKDFIILKDKGPNTNETNFELRLWKKKYL
jgi:hypothetical protein